MPRLFISHSSKDNIQARAFQRWLMANGWAKKDVFIDLDGIGAGERWRDALRKAKASCEVVLLLASPDALDSKECLREMNLAEHLEREIIVAILRDLKNDDPRLAGWSDKQFVDLSTEKREYTDSFEYDGAIHHVHFHLPALNAISARLVHLGIAPGSFAWTPPKKDAGPFPGLAAFDENDAGIFFGRDAVIMAGITDLRTMRKRRSPRLLVIVAASGAGKSSYLRAGLWPRLKRDADFAPLCILRPAQGILTGPDGLGRMLAPWFELRGHSKVPGDIHSEITQASATAATTALAALLIEATAIATTARQSGAPGAMPPAPLIAIDQGEELFAPENTAESERFLGLLAALLRDPPNDVDPYVLITIRVDSLDALLQRWSTLGLDTPQLRYLLPLSPSAYREVIIRPVEVYSDRERRVVIEPDLVEALVQDAYGGDALPLLAFTLERLFSEFAADGELTLARYNAMGRIGGSIDRTLAEAQHKVGASAETLRRLVVPGLATWDPDPNVNAAKRLVPKETDLTGGDRTNLAPLAHALVEARLLTRNLDTLEVAHEALLRRPPIDGWLEAQKDALKLRDDVLKEAEEWKRDDKSAKDLVRRGERLKMATDLAANDDFTNALSPAKQYLEACREVEGRARRESENERDARARAQRRLRYGAVVAALSLFAALAAFAFPTGLRIDAEEDALPVSKPRNWTFDRSGSKVAAIVEEIDGAPHAKVWQISPRLNTRPIITVAANDSTLSPDGGHLAIMRNGQLFVHATNGPSAPVPAIADFRGPPGPEGERPEIMNPALAFSSDGKWLMTVPFGGEIQLFETAATENRISLGKVKQEDLERGLINISPSRTRTEFLICNSTRVSLVRPDRVPRILSVDLESQHFGGCDYAGRENLVVAKSADHTLSILAIQENELRLLKSIVFPSKQITEAQVEREGRRPVSYVVNHAGTVIFGRSADGPLAQARLEGSKLTHAEIFVPPRLQKNGPQRSEPTLWAADNDKWFAGTVEDGELYVWGADQSTVSGLPRETTRVSRRSEAPFFSALKKSDVALLSIGGGVLRPLDLGKPKNVNNATDIPKKKARLGGQSYRLAPLFDDSGWQATSTAEVLLVSSDFSILQSSAVQNDIDTTIRAADGSVLWATTEVGLTRFRRVVKLWGITILALEWPRILYGSESSFGPTTSDGGRVPLRGGGDGGDGGGGP
ncbi:MAG: toll/interleukin-1 receptor domain-containing protein [Hyphomicrobiaceae bacterium]